MTGKEPLWTIAELERALAGEAREVIGQCAGPLGPVVTDSRRISRGCIFIAIRGAKFDGHDFVAGASAAGAGAVVVEHRVEGCSCPQIAPRSCALPVERPMRLPPSAISTTRLACR